MSQQNVPCPARAEESSEKSPATAQSDGERLKSDLFVAQSATGSRFGKFAVLQDASTEVPPWGRFPKLETCTPKAFWFRRIQCDPTVEAVYRRLQQLEGPSFINSSRVAGVLAPNLRAKMLPNGRDQLMLPQKEARNSKTLVDHPRLLLPVDFDHLRRPGFNALEDWAECGNELRDWLDRLDLEWLMGDCVLTLSSSYGLRGLNIFKVHAEFILSNPATIKQQKNIGQYVNAKVDREKVELAPTQYVIDTLIYAPYAPIYSRAPDIQWYHPDAKGMPVVETLKLPFPRVHLVRMGRERITPPEEALHFGEKRPKVVAWENQP